MCRDTIDRHFMARLRAAGIVDAAAAIGLPFEQVLLPLAQSVDHPYRQFRWSVGTDEHGSQVIHAVPPEEEMGWTPWERWAKSPQGLRRTEWVLFPARRGSNDRSGWYELGTEPDDLRPRFFPQTDRSLEKILQQARIDVAASIISLDLHRELLAPMTSNAVECYLRYRWVVIPHLLAANLPVIYALPPMHRSDEWPWESWYTDDGKRLLHHVHFTKSNDRTTGGWRERDGAPQRPPEIFGVEWYWHDDPSMRPALI